MIDLDHAPELPAIDVGAPAPLVASSPPVMDRRAFEERYAELGFGLGVVPRKTRRDDPLWETPAGVLAILGAFLALIGLFASAR